MAATATLVRTLQDALQQKGVASIAKQQTAYFKNVIVFRGLKSIPSILIYIPPIFAEIFISLFLYTFKIGPVVESVFKEHKETLKELESSDALQLASELMKSKYSEDKV